MGFFYEIISSDARRGATRGQAPTPALRTPAPKPAPAPPAAAMETPGAQPAPKREAVSVPVPAAPVPEAELAPAKSAGEPAAAPELPEQQIAPALDLTADSDAADEDERKRAHETAEAKRKAEFDAKQERKRAAEQEQLDRVAAMSDETVIASAVQQAADATDRMTNRSMKDSVSAHIQDLCRADPAFARLTMHPRKSMLHCIQYIFRQAKDYLEKELKAGGIKVSGSYGGDVPDGLVLRWAEQYYRTDAADIKEDSQDEERFIPKPYVSSTRKTSKTKAAKKKPEKKPTAEKPKTPEEPKAPELEQMSLM